uniref:Calmodulin-lysine N-methyltransferase n=2 Tax=Schistosoma mansoni TaxID=6183 RepID=A0A5K4F099_SCHMA
MNKENRNSSQLWSVLARAVKCSYKEGKPKLSCNRHFEANHLTKKVFEIHSLEQPAEIDENTLWLELVPRPVIHQSNDSLELPTIVSSLHVRIYKTLGIAKTTDSCMNPLLDVLTGFDNTGNVHLWFSEILLAHSMFFDCLYPGLWNELYKNFDDHPIENVCELCAGMTGAAGLAISLRKYSNIFKTSYVLITDGNDQCVASISSIIEHNSKRLLDNCNLDQPFLLHMDVKNIRWPDDSSQSSSSLIAELDESLIHRFDLIMAADCFFDQSYHFSMLNTINRLLSLQSGSTFLAISPLRGNSLHNFINLAYQMEQTYSWTVKLISPSDYLSSQFISYLIDESNRLQFTDSELDSKIGHLIAFTRTN